MYKLPRTEPLRKLPWRGESKDEAQLSLADAALILHGNVFLHFWYERPFFTFVTNPGVRLDAQLPL